MRRYVDDEDQSWIIVIGRSTRLYQEVDRDRLALVCDTHHVPVTWRTNAQNLRSVHERLIRLSDENNPQVSPHFTVRIKYDQQQPIK